MIECPLCGADMPILLGELGNLTWFRCQQCGAEFNLKTSEVREREEA